MSDCGGTGCTVRLRLGTVTACMLTYWPYKRHAGHVWGWGRRTPYMGKLGHFEPDEVQGHAMV